MENKVAENENQIDEAKVLKQKKINKIFNIIIVVLVLVLIFTIFMRFSFEKYLISKTSMTPTILDGEEVLIYKRGEVDIMDIVVFLDKDVYNEVLIKRVVGTGGDSIKIEGNVLYVKSENSDEIIKIEEDYICDENITLDWTKIPKDKLFVLGDNRIVSYDSSEFGAISKDSIIGKVVKIYNKKD